jgi:hypothetical protein
MTSLPISSNLIASNGADTSSLAPLALKRSVQPNTFAPFEEAPPSPTASLQGDKYVLVRAPKPQSRVALSAVGDAKAVVVKTASATVDQKSELRTNNTTAGGVVQRGMKSKLQPTSLMIPFSFAMQAASTGICSAVVAVTPDSNSAEWSALSALYDEYRLDRVTVDYAIPALTPAPGASGLGPDTAMSVLAYDPVDSSALNAVRNGVEYSQHNLVSAKPAYVTATTGTATAKFGFYPKGETFRLDVKIPKVAVTAFNSSGVALATPGQWTAVLNAGSNLPQGWIKAYMTTDFSTTSTAICGVMRCWISLRSRR